ncbi:MAG: ABC transporter ATP-binding protein/permease [Candidatus Fimenecus sp.]
MIDKALMKFLGKSRKYIYYSVLSMTLGFIANASTTAIICEMFSLAIKKSRLKEYGVWFIFLFFSLSIRFITTRISSRLKDEIGCKVKKIFREKIYNKIVGLGLKTTNGISMAGLTQLSVEGIEQLDLYYSSYVPQFFFAMLCPLILFFICVGINWKYAFILLLCVPLIPLSIMIVSKYAKRIFSRYWDEYTSMGDIFLDSIQGLKELKIFRADEQRHKLMNEKSEKFRKITMKVLVMQLASTTIMDLVAYGGAGAGISVAIYSAMNGMDISKALFLILVAVEFFLPLRAFGSAFHIAMNGLSAGKKIMSLLSEKEQLWGNEQADIKSIKLDKVNFAYNDSREILNNISMDFPQKKFTAIVGESGSGKSTIVGLITGALSCNSGMVFVGDKKIYSLSRESYYSSISVVSCNTYIFNKTIRENFFIANSNLSDNKIYTFLKTVLLYDFICKNGGLDMIIAEDASNLSGGQKQRLALAISLAADKDVYIFDEATSNIDSESEKILMKNIIELSKRKTVILISHRLENVIYADNIYFIDSGKVKEFGTHKQLMQNNSDYAYLYKKQKELAHGYLEKMI